MSETYAGFVDIGFLQAQGAKLLGYNTMDVRPDASAIVKWLSDLALRDQIFLRSYWYDGSYDASHANYAGQRSYFNAIALTSGLQLRLGHIAMVPSPIEQPIRRALELTAVGLGIEPEEMQTEFDRHWTFRPTRQQKGVDTLIALDMVRLASRSVCTTMVLIAGDRDLAEAVRAAQDFGVRVLVATPMRHSVAREVTQLADEMLEIDKDAIGRMLTLRQATPGHG